VKTRIIPAIDILSGKCVRLTKGAYETAKIYDNQPLDVALRFQDLGVTHLHLVDLDGAREKKVVNHKVLELLASRTDLRIDFGGGIQSDIDIQIAFNSGAEKVTGGSVAVKNPQLFERWIDEYSPNRIILGADSNNGYISVSGWQEQSTLAIEPFIKHFLDKKITTVIATDIAKDGMLQGPSIELYKQLLSALGADWNLIASGGVRSLSDIEQLNEIGCHGAIVGKALYEHTLSLEDIRNYHIS